MGISDKDYANALEHQRLHQIALMQLEMQKQQEEAKMASNILGALGQLVTGAGLAGQSGLQSNGTGGYYSPAQQQAMYNSATTSVTTGTAGTNTPAWVSNASVYSGVRPVTEQDLKHDAMLAPLSALIDMWTMRWQGEWVNEQEFQEDEFWRLALIRLTGANKLEKHNLANQYHSVYRIIE